MGREVRMVPQDWEHPKYDLNHPKVVNEGCTYLVGRYIPKFNQPYTEALAEWKEGKKQWELGFQPNYPAGALSTYEPKADYQKNYSWVEYAGQKPKKEGYMPDWPASERTHYMMYETTSEGTPISPAFATPEELAKWLADTGASSFGHNKATYKQWLITIHRGSSVSAVIDSNGIRSGVEATEL